MTKKIKCLISEIETFPSEYKVGSSFALNLQEKLSSQHSDAPGFQKRGFVGRPIVLEKGWRVTSENMGFMTSVSNDLFRYRIRQILNVGEGGIWPQVIAKAKFAYIDVNHIFWKSRKAALWMHSCNI